MLGSRYKLVNIRAGKSLCSGPGVQADPLVGGEGTPQMTLKTFELKTAQAKARI